MPWRQKGQRRSKRGRKADKTQRGAVADLQQPTEKCVHVCLCKQFIHNSIVVWVVCTRSFVFSSFFCAGVSSTSMIQSLQRKKEIPAREERKREAPSPSLLQRGLNTLQRILTSPISSSFSSHCIHSFTLTQCCSHSPSESHFALFNPHFHLFLLCHFFIPLTSEKFYSARQLVSKQRASALLRPTPPPSSAPNGCHHIPFPSSLSLLHSSLSSTITTSFQPN